MSRSFTLELKNARAGGDTPLYTNYNTLKNGIASDQRSDKKTQLDHHAANHDPNSSPTAVRRTAGCAALSPPTKTLIQNDDERKASR